MFMRTDKLKRLFESVERADLNRVYVADDGEETAKKDALYASNWSFDLTV